MLTGGCQHADNSAQLLTLAHRWHSQEGKIGYIQAREGRMSIRPWAAGNVTRKKELVQFEPGSRFDLQYLGDGRDLLARL
jgi:hypothetical protein